MFQENIAPRHIFIDIFDRFPNEEDATTFSTRKLYAIRIFLRSRYNVERTR